MELQKQGIIDQVQQSQKSGRKTKDILQALGVKPSTYYRWLKHKSIVNVSAVLHPSDRKTSMSLTEEDRL